MACKIVARQQSFFSSGDIALHLLVSREIADNLELHESTVPRVTNHKYLSYPLSLFELKQFFSQFITSKQGNRISTTTVQEIIDATLMDAFLMRPLSDYLITRRALVKYRESLRIPAMHLRRH